MRTRCEFCEKREHDWLLLVAPDPRGGFIRYQVCGHCLPKEDAVRVSAFTYAAHPDVAQLYLEEQDQYPDEEDE